MTSRIVRDQRLEEPANLREARQVAQESEQKQERIDLRPANFRQFFRSDHTRRALRLSEQMLKSVNFAAEKIRAAFHAPVASYWRLLGWEESASRSSILASKRFSAAICCSSFLFLVP